MNIPLRQYWDLLATYLRPQRGRVALLTVLLLTSTALPLLNPLLLRSFIDTAVDGGAMRTLVWLAALFIGVALVTQAIQVATTYVSEQVGWRATNALRADLALHALGLDMPFHNSHTPGEMIERIDGDVTALTNFFSQFVIRVLGSALMLLGVIVLLVIENRWVGTVFCLFTLLSLVVLGRVRNIGVPRATAERQANADLFGFIEERLAGVEDIRTNGGGHYVMRRLHENGRGLYAAAQQAQQTGAVMWMTTTSLFTLGTVLVLAMGAYMYHQGQITIGTVYLFFQYMQMLRRPLELIADQLKEFQRASAGVGRVHELKGLRSDIPDGAGLPLPAGPLAVELDDLSFGYGEKEPVVAGLSFKVAPGRVLGVLGRTGSGKTTLTRLLLRLYDPAGGAIRLSGVDVRDARLAELRHRVGIVTQDVQLFQASVRDNLTLFDPSISDERIMAVLADLGLLDWFFALPQGLDTELASGGAGLSAGEGQLLAFARVFLRDPGLVILDEASSRLDPATERLTERAVDRLLARRTGIVIAHRLGTVQRADEILILEDGRIREHGARESLARDPASRFAGLLRTGLEEVLA
jgi:ABC-type multidrug transport system fused ATPase/permease subunit